MTNADIRQDLGRAKNAVQEYLRRKLLVPKIYLDANWDEANVDVLAIDRAGVGDVHLVRLAPVLPTIEQDWRYIVTRAAGLAGDEIEKLHSLHAQYRYVALVGFSPGIGQFQITEPLARKALAEDGVGRIGILSVDLSQDEPPVQSVLKGERFRSSEEIVAFADQFVASHTPNWEVRE